jgi:hypothetical protein
VRNQEGNTATGGRRLTANWRYLRRTELQSRRVLLVGVVAPQAQASCDRTGKISSRDRERKQRGRVGVSGGRPWPRLTWRGHGGDERGEEEDKEEEAGGQHEERLLGVALHSACLPARERVGVYVSERTRCHQPGTLKLHQWGWMTPGAAGRAAGFILGLNNGVPHWRPSGRLAAERQLKCLYLNKCYRLFPPEGEIKNWTATGRSGTMPVPLWFNLLYDRSAAPPHYCTA